MTLRRHAEKTRKWAEAYGKENGFDRDLCGMCAIAAAHLFCSLKRDGYSPILVNANEEHIFVHVGHFLIDTTATQFGRYKKVEIRRHKQVKQFFWTHDLKFMNSVAVLKKIQKKADWPMEQRVATVAVAMLEGRI